MSEEWAILVYLLVALCLGLFFAFCGRDRIRADGIFAMPAFGFASAVALVLLAPGATYLSATHPDWSWMYFFEPSAMALPLALAWAALAVVALVLGWSVGAKFVRAGHTRWIALPLGAGVLALAIAVFALAGRLTAYATYDGFHAGVSAGLMDVKLGYALVIVALATAASSARAALDLARDSRRVRAR